MDQSLQQEEAKKMIFPPPFPFRTGNQRPKKLRDVYKATELFNSIAKNNTPVGLRAEFCPQLPFKSENINSWGEEEVFYFFSSPFGVLTHNEYSSKLSQVHQHSSQILNHLMVPSSFTNLDVLMQKLLSENSFLPSSIT